jgi:hypothetical protein
VLDLSVIVTSYRSPDLLRRCLASLTDQIAIGEIVVADCSPDNPEAWVREAFPRVRVLHAPERRTVPELRWGAVPHTTGAIVAAIEARCVAAPDWGAALNAAHERHPRAPAVGGPVRLKPHPSIFDWGLYFAEFGHFAPPLEEGGAPQLSGANLSYKRDALESCADLLRAGAWEAALHERWRREGRELYVSRATVEFQNGMRRRDAIRMRFHYGRSYAAGRFAPDALERRVIYGLGAVALPALLTWRAARSARRAGLIAAFWRSSPWVLLLNGSWAAGECAGYLAGRSSRAEIY